VLVNQFYVPDVAATGQLLGDLAEHLAADGRVVQVLTSRGRYAGPDRTRRAYEVRRGVRVRRLPVTNWGRGPGRLLDYATFFLGAAIWSLRARRGQIWVFLSTPPLIALLGVLARRRGARFVYKVEDLYPDVALALGALRPGPLARLLAALSHGTLRRADAVVALSDAMAAHLVERGGDLRPPTVIPNWSDGDAVRPVTPAQSRLRARLGIPPDAFAVGYCGNLGRAHALEGLLDIAADADLAARGVHVLIVGRGAWVERFEMLARQRPSVHVLDYRDRAELPDALAAADLHVVAVRREVEGLLFPSKLAGVLAAGRPVLALAARDGDLGTLVRTKRLGWVTDLEPGAAEAAVREALEDPTSLQAAALRARHAFEAEFGRRAALEAWSAVLR
jgi:glycosyltransferase involved in cell wall biosynthesis